jgi:CheY-like chemotaxis protein
MVYGFVRQSGGRVLLVEDDALIRMSASEMLMDLGHVVTEAENGPDALALVERGRFEMMLTDLSLPGMADDALAAAAVAHQPKLGVTFASGYDRVPNCDAALAQTMLLQKLYDEGALAAALKTVTGGWGDAEVELGPHRVCGTPTSPSPESGEGRSGLRANPSPAFGGRREGVPTMFLPNLTPY